MPDARTLLFDALTALPDGERVASSFAEDGVLELPFLHSVGFPTRYQRREAISKFYSTVEPFLTISNSSERTSPF